MRRISEIDRETLIQEIASKAYTPSQLANKYETDIATLRQFVTDHREQLRAARDALEGVKAEASDVTPGQLDDLWISNKFERLQRYQDVAEALYESLTEGGSAALDSTTLREFRSYLAAAANELGQLMHRGSGESGTDSSLSVDIQGVDIENFR